MNHQPLPREAADVLDIPSDSVPDVIHRMLRERAMSPLMARIHDELRSRDPERRSRSIEALRRLGFPD